MVNPNVGGFLDTNGIAIFSEYFLNVDVSDDYIALTLYEETEAGEDDGAVFTDDGGVGADFDLFGGLGDGAGDVDDLLFG